MKLPEIDPIVLNRIRSQTTQKQIQESRQSKVAGEKKERDRQDGGGKQGHKGKQSLEESLEVLNRAMKEAGRSIRFQLVQSDGAAMVQILDTAQNRVIREVLPEKVRLMVSRVRDMMGMLMDELI